MESSIWVMTGGLSSPVERRQTIPANGADYRPIVSDLVGDRAPTGGIDRPRGLATGCARGSSPRGASSPFPRGRCARGRATRRRGRVARRRRERARAPHRSSPRSARPARRRVRASSRRRRAPREVDDAARVHDEVGRVQDPTRRERVVDVESGELVVGGAAHRAALQARDAVEIDHRTERARREDVALEVERGVGLADGGAQLRRQRLGPSRRAIGQGQHGAVSGDEPREVRADMADAVHDDAQALERRASRRARPAPRASRRARRPR